jgi:catechol 2,3-dioxygenase-like lactoylglutathione lyase family enzyme
VRQLNVRLRLGDDQHDRGQREQHAADGEQRHELEAERCMRAARAKAFYQSLGWRLDADLDFGNDIRAVQLTPTHSSCSIAFGTGITTAEPGSAQRMELVVSNIDTAREDLVSRGVDVSELFHRDENGLAPGPDPQRRSYFTFASFSDPDGNTWLLQEITERRPGREWED